MNHHTLIDDLVERATEVLRPLLAPIERYALIEFPHYANVGDSAIFLGQLELLRRMGLPEPAYVCDIGTFVPEMLSRQVGGGTILLTGGGGFGDLWPEGQRFRERVVSTFRENPIIQLPQSIHFRDRATLDRARRVLHDHPRFTLLAREEQSLERALSDFDVTTRLCPDAALFLGPLERPRAADRPVVWLARGDKEAVPDAWPEAGMAARADWLDESPSVHRAAVDGLASLVRLRPGSAFLRRLLTKAYRPLAQERLARGCRHLSRGRVVVTDRLHGHILALLLGIPHVVHDNSYGKVSSFYRTWTSRAKHVRWASSRVEAWSLAEDMLSDAELEDHGS